MDNALGARSHTYKGVTLGWQISLFGVLIRLVVTVAITFLIYQMLREKRTTTRFNSAIVAIVALGALWLADIEGSTRLVFLGLEIDHRVESAREILDRLTALEKTGSETTTLLEEAQQKAKKTANELGELITKEEETFEITRLQSAALNGERKAYVALCNFKSDDPDLLERASVAMWSVKRFYIGTTKIRGVKLYRTMPEEKDIKGSDFKTTWLLEALAQNPEWKVRARAAELLGSRKEFGVPEALLDAMEQDRNLWVAKHALTSFRYVTGFKSTDVFEFETGRPQKWYEKNKEEVLQKLKKRQELTPDEGTTKKDAEAER